RGAAAVKIGRCQKHEVIAKSETNRRIENAGDAVSKNMHLGIRPHRHIRKAVPVKISNSHGLYGRRDIWSRGSKGEDEGAVALARKSLHRPHASVAAVGNHQIRMAIVVEVHRAYINWERAGRKRRPPGKGTGASPKEDADRARDTVAAIEHCQVEFSIAIKIAYSQTVGKFARGQYGVERLE